MRVVTRGAGESLLIELPTRELSEVTVVRVKGKQVRLPTGAPKHLPAVRGQLPGESAQPPRECQPPARKNLPLVFVTD